jgi:hypothetical protein
MSLALYYCGPDNIPEPASIALFVAAIVGLQYYRPTRACAPCGARPFAL